MQKKQKKKRTNCQTAERVSSCRVVEPGVRVRGARWDPEKLQGSPPKKTWLVSRWQYDMSPKCEGENNFCWKKKREICAITQWNDSASKVLQGAVKECFGWRLVQAPPTFNRCSRELQKPGGWLFTVENSVRTHKTFPPPRNWYSVQKQAAARTDEATRQLSDTTETCEIQNQNQEKNRRPRLGKIAGGRGGGGFGGDPTLLNEAKRWPSISHDKLQQLRCWDAHLP